MELTDIDTQNNVSLKILKGTDLKALALELIPVPNYYNELNNDGLAHKQIALMHGDRCLASTVTQTCKYWRGDQQCKFCAIEFSLDSGATIEKKNAAQLIETIHAARRDDPTYSQHITLTPGTTANADKGMAEYLEILPALKREFPDINIHIQIEPMGDLSWYQRVHDAGADTVGIHLEILDDDLRKEICPGKSALTLDVYLTHWTEAVRVFGTNQVDTFILTGFESDVDELKRKLVMIVDTGVIPLITPMRYIEGVKFDVKSLSSSLFLEIILFTAELFLKKGLDPSQSKAGCLRCEGCSPVIDAFRVVSQK